MVDQPVTRLERASAGSIGAAADLLKAGRLVAFPTETVYGLGADAGNARAVADLYAAKGRPSFNPLIAHVKDHAAAARIGAFDARADRLAAQFWPGPLTMVVPLRDGTAVCDLARAGLPTVGLRVPSHPVAQALLHAVDRAVVAPSANRSGRVSPTTAQHVFDDMQGRIDHVVDGGRTAVGVESTILAVIPGEPVRLLRPGGLPRQAIEAVLGEPLAGAGAMKADAPAAPGMLSSHYAPRARMRLNVGVLRPGEALLAFGPDLPAGASQAVARLQLSPTGDLAEAAANLFDHLRSLDAALAGTPDPVIAVAPIPPEGLGEAINDRLARAAAPR